MVLVTGATGLLGRVIVLELIKKGKKVRACKRSGSNLADIKNSYRYYSSKADFYFDLIDWVDLDFSNHQSLYDALKDITEVYHCAAKISFDPKDWEEVLETGIVYTRNLLRACLQMRIKKFLFVSSAATLHINKKDMELRINENQSKKKYSPYVISKYFCEKMVWSAHKDGLNAVIISPGMIIGSGNWEKENSQLLDVFLKSRITFPGGTSCVDVRDVSTLAVRLMEENIFGEQFYISAENALYKDLAYELRKTAGLSKPIIINKKILNILKYLRPILKIVDRKARFLTDENIEFVCDHQYHSGKKIKSKMQYHFYSASESIHFHYGNYLNKKFNEKNSIKTLNKNKIYRQYDSKHMI